MFRRFRFLDVFALGLLLSAANGGVLIISPQYLEIPSLRLFDEKLYNSLKDSIENGRIVSYLWELPLECGYFGHSRNSAYLPSVIYYPDDAIELDQTGMTCDDIREKFAELNKEDPNTIYLFINKAKKHKREAPSSTTDEPKTTEKPTYTREKVVVDPDAPVVYNAQGKTLLYSSKAIKFKTGDTETLLGAATFCTNDDRDTYSRLIANIPVDDVKYALRFKFPWESGYWRLKSVEIGDSEGRIYNLSVTTDIYAPKSFSYSCGGVTVFTDGSSWLYIHDLQVQPVTKNGRFDDAYNCVPFTTGPIWSGLFVTALLGFGLFVGLTALSSIKTMDKFDNSKTKQLTITLMGE